MFKVDTRALKLAAWKQLASEEGMLQIFPLTFVMSLACKVQNPYQESLMFIYMYTRFAHALRMLVNSFS